VVTEVAGAGDSAVWLTIDDGPDPEDTPVLLRQLDEAGAKATFFLIGHNAQKHPELVKAILDAGHQVGNHTLHHRAGLFWAMSARRVREEIAGCQRILNQHGAGEIPWFRAPAGLRNHGVHPVLESLGLRLAGWSLRGFDGVSTDAPKIIERLRKGLRPGVVVLIHEGRKAKDGQRLAPQLLAVLLQELRERGWVTVLPAVRP
jgi:peptidoglycan/xylan/chitin deacetylase (PgdA/CDA1 family)